MEVRETVMPRTFMWSLFLLILLVPLGKYHVYIGFALKPYMLFLFIYFVIHYSSFYFHKLHLFEWGMLLFYLIYSFSGVFSQYPGSSVRIVIGIILYLICYFLSKAVIGNASMSMIEKSISTVGILFNTVSLMLYVIGLKHVEALLGSDQLISYGVLIDREYPRLIGLWEDPNYFVFYNTLFFAYFLCNARSAKNKLGLVLSVLASLLTLSRGGLLVLAFIFVLYILTLNRPIKQFKLVVGMVITFAIGACVVINFLNFDLIGVLQQRVDALAIDGGSMRFELWGRALQFFDSKMWMGIGANNFLNYNEFQYGDSLHAHNTFLEILTETGLIGMCCFLLFTLLVFVQMFKADMLRKKPYLFLTFVAYLFQMAFLSVIINDMFLLFLAILAVYLHKSREDHETSEVQKP